jgi:hypothetical protein
MKDIRSNDALVADCLISARLLMLQSKRLILATLERRLNKQRRESLRPRVDRLRAETRRAHEQYTSSVLRWGTPERPEYWPAAYGRLVETADRLSTKLRLAAVELPPEERYQLSAEVEMLEELVERWRHSIRSAMLPVA